MTLRLRLHLAVVFALFTIPGLGLSARQTRAPARPAPARASALTASPATAPLNTIIPVDPQITVGTLPNGLRYYIRANKKPEDRAELRLVVNAGSVLEEDDQRGMAHMVEHMAFNGTKHFPKQDIISFIESIGMRFGSDLNAYTGFDETVYMLEVPTDAPAVLDRAMLVLQDWAHDVTFDPAEIDKERGVIMEEWRLGRGAGARMRDKQFPVLLQGSRFADRLPIGLTDVIQHGKAERLVQFYKDWYRPDLMAVVAVGDFDKTAIETLIKSHFGSIPRAISPRRRPEFPVPAHEGTRYATATDKEARTTAVSVYSTMPAPDQSTLGAYRQQQVVDELFALMLNARLSEIAQRPNAPFLGASAGRGLLVHTADAATLDAVVSDNGVEAGLGALFAEAERVSRFGFTPAEFERQKTNLLRNIERAIAEKDNQNSGNLAAEYIRNFLQKEPIPGIAYEYELYKRFLPDVKIAEVNALANSWTADRNRVVLVNAPEKAGVTVPADTTLAAVMAGVKGASLQPWEDAAAAAPLMPTAPVPGTIVSTSTRSELGLTEWTLSNGVRVILKPTTFRQDEVVFRAFAPGGTSLASDADYIPATTAAQVVAAGGLGTLTATDLRKALTGTVASAAPYIGEVDEGLSGGGSPKDLDTIFQLIHLRFTAPRADPTMFGVMTQQTKAALANQTAQPEFAFSRALTEALYGDHPRTRPLTPERVDEMNLQKSMVFYRDRFADASRFTFVFVGSFDPAALRPFVEKYLASLPATHGNETWRDVGIRPVRGVVERRVNKGIEPKSEAALVFTGPFQYDQAHRTAIRAMSMVLENRLRESLREDLGGTYSVSASPSYSKMPREEYRFVITFGCAPDRTDALVDQVFKEIDAVQASEPDPRIVADIRQQLKREYETSSRENGFLLREMTSRYENGEDVSELFTLPESYDKLTGAAILDAARTYLDKKNFVRVELFPEK
jgi:zinc protease